MTTTSSKQTASAMLAPITRGKYAEFAALYFSSREHLRELRGYVRQLEQTGQTKMARKFLIVAEGVAKQVRSLLREARRFRELEGLIP